MLTWIRLIVVTMVVTAGLVIATSGRSLGSCDACGGGTGPTCPAPG